MKLYCCDDHLLIRTESRQDLAYLQHIGFPVPERSKQGEADIEINGVCTTLYRGDDNGVGAGIKIDAHQK